MYISFVRNKSAIIADIETHSFISFDILLANNKIKFNGISIIILFSSSFYKQIIIVQ